MKRREITLLSDLGRRPPEAGRIRMGVQVPVPNKPGQTRPKALDKFRFTSQDKGPIEEIARLYGGTVERWHDEKASPKDQWQVLTPVSEIRVYIMPDGLDTVYELWSGRGCARRCNGALCEVPQQVGSDYELVEVDCICRAQGSMECDPHTRLQVVLPELNFTGVWRLESKGWNAAQELPGMFDLIAALSAQGKMVDANLSIQKVERMTPAGPRKFIVPRLTVRSTVLQLQSGGPVLAVGPASDMPALTTGALDLRDEPVGGAFDDITDAEIIDDELLDLEAKLRNDAVNFGLDPTQYVGAIKSRCVTDGELDREKVRKAIAAVREGRKEPIGFDQGVVIWKDVS